MGVREAQPWLALAPHAPHAPARLDGGTPLSRGPLPSPALRVNARPGPRRLWGEELPVRGRPGKHDMAQAEQEPPDASPRTRGSQLSLDEKRTDLELKVVKSVTAGGGGGWLRAPPWGVATGVGGARVLGEGPRKPARSRRWSPSRESRRQAALGPEPCSPPPHLATPRAPQSWFRSRRPAARTHAAAGARPRSAAGAAGAARATLPGPSRRCGRASPRLALRVPELHLPPSGGDAGMANESPWSRCPGCGDARQNFLASAILFRAGAEQKSAS